MTVAGYGRKTPLIRSLMLVLLGRRCPACILLGVVHPWYGPEVFLLLVLWSSKSPAETQIGFW